MNVRQLQRKLWTAAKQSPERRFHALYDRIHRSDVLWEAWHRVKDNRGAAGVDRVTLAYVQDVYGVERMPSELFGPDEIPGLVMPNGYKRSVSTWFGHLNGGHSRD